MQFVVWLHAAFMNGLRSIVNSTSVVRHPERFEEEVRRAIMSNAGLLPAGDDGTGEASAR